MKKVEYNLLYKFDKMPDGCLEKFNGRLDCLPAELSLMTKFGAPDIMIESHLPLSMYDEDFKKKNQLARQKYKNRGDSISQLVQLIKNNISPSAIIDGEYLYELWISRIFGLDWSEDNLNIDSQLNLLINEISINSNINPFTIDVDKVQTNVNNKKRFRNIVENIFKNIKC